MKKRNLFCLVFILSLVSSFAQENNKWDISVHNPGNLQIKDAFLTLDITPEISQLINDQDLLLYDNGNIISYQVIDEKGINKFAFVTDLQRDEKKVLQLRRGRTPDFKNRTYAELAMKPVELYDGKKFRGNKFEIVDKIKVPAVHTDHDALFKYEGPGWESEVIGYRFYLDWRNATDIFGKKVKGLILDQVGNEDTVAKDDSYHNMQSWGMDIFKVGNTLGIGSVSMMVKDSIYMVSVTDSIHFEMIDNGPLRSGFKTSYYGWKAGDERYTIHSFLSINAGSRMTKCVVQTEGNPSNITTGLAKYDGTEFIRSNSEGDWSYIALYGKQSLSSPDDQLGIAVFFKNKDLIEQSENNINYYVVLKPGPDVEYYFCAAWDKEPDGITTIEGFTSYLDSTIKILNNPPVAELTSFN
jgi:hypothetical protein